jgi:hypothetical protein
MTDDNDKEFLTDEEAEFLQQDRQRVIAESNQNDRIVRSLSWE